jgi:hypothetical protein
MPNKVERQKERDALIAEVLEKVNIVLDKLEEIEKQVAQLKSKGRKA